MPENISNLVDLLINWQYPTINDYNYDIFYYIYNYNWNDTDIQLAKIELEQSYQEMNYI